MIGMAKSTQKNTKVSSSKTKDLSPSKVLAIVANWNNTESPAKSPAKGSRRKRPRDEQLSASVPRSRRQRKHFRRDYLSQSSEEDELPTFKAKSFYHGQQPTKYLSPFERKEERDRLIDAGVDPAVLNKSFEELQRERIGNPLLSVKERPAVKSSSLLQKKNSVANSKTISSTSNTPSTAEKTQALKPSRPKRQDSSKPAATAESKVQLSSGQMSGVKGEIKVTLSERSPGGNVESKKMSAGNKAPPKEVERRSSPRKLDWVQPSPKVTKNLGGLVARRTSPRKLASKGNAAKGIQMYMRNLKQGQKKGKKASIVKKSKEQSTKTKNQTKVVPAPTKAEIPAKASASKSQRNQTPTTNKEKVDSSASNEKAARGLDFGTGMVNGHGVAPLVKNPDGRNEKSHTEDNLMDFLVFADDDFRDENRDTEDFVQNLLMEIDDDMEETENLLKRSPRKRKMKTDKECVVSSPSPGKSPKRQTPNRRRMSSTPNSSKKSQPRLDGWLSKIDALPTSARSPRKKSALQRSEVIGQVADVLTPDSTNVSPPKVSPNKPTKLYSVFTPPRSPHLNTTPKSKKKQSNAGKLKSPNVQERSPLIKSLKSKTDNLEQTTLDLGQKRYGAVTCATCGTVYTAAHPEDETDHARFHKKYLSSIKFPGWKQEEVLESFHDGRIIVITHEAPHYAEKKVDEIRELVDRELGFMEASHTVSKDLCKTYLFITLDKKVGGCLIAEQITQGYRVIVDEQKAEGNDSQKAWCCETESEPALCGISRIWVPMATRRKQIASRMVDCLRKNFMFGTVLSPDDVAFSDPTPDGKNFATKYTGTPRFLVYKYH